MRFNNVFSKGYCVYAHYINDHDCIYIGSGKIERAFSCSRDIDWRAIADKNIIDVEILALFDNRSDAFILEKQKILELRPICNKMSLPSKKKSGAIRCIETNKIYGSSIEAALDTGFSQGAISNVVNGRYSSVGGFHFERYVGYFNGTYREA